VQRTSSENLTEVDQNVDTSRRFTRRVRMYKEGYISVHVYLNVERDGRKFYDTVVYRKIKKGSDFEHVRGANFKPYDIPVVIKLLQEASDFLASELPPQ